MILSILSLLGGGLMRLLPEVISFFHKKEDNAHETVMMQYQVQLETLRAQQQATAPVPTVNQEQMLSILSAQRDAMAEQFQPTGFKLADALNVLVRPTFAYWSLALYSGIKLAQLCGAWPNLQAMIALYTDTDFAMLQGICSFYFVGRVFDKAKK